MTNDEAFERWMEIVGEMDKIQKTALFTIIDKANYDFESRTCENCKYMSYWVDADIAECSKNEPQLNWKTMEPLSFFEVTFDFSCNKWEDKDG